MGRKPGESSGGGGGGGRSLSLLILVAFVCCALVYTVFSAAVRRSNPAAAISGLRSVTNGEEEEDEVGECCRGIENLELWGEAVKWGTDHKFNNSHECCQACKNLCRAGDGPCLCNSWVYCGDRNRCGDKFGECWLKKQKDVLFPALVESGEKVVWTSGLIFGKGEGIVGLETEHGTLHIKLHPDCAPKSVAYIAELLGSRHCAGCQLYRAEGRGVFWDSEGNHMPDASHGPPYALIQGTLEAEGIPFRAVPREACPVLRRGSVAWIGAGPDFFISLANHDEWNRSYTVFGSVLPEDMEVAEKIVELPTRPDVWGDTNVAVLEKPVHLKLRRITTSQGANSAST